MVFVCIPVTLLCRPSSGSLLSGHASACKKRKMQKALSKDLYVLCYCRCESNFTVVNKKINKISLSLHNQTNCLFSSIIK